MEIGVSQLPWQTSLCELAYFIYNEIMATKNYTPIDDLIKKWKSPMTGNYTKEAEPLPRRQEVAHLQEAVEHEPSVEVKPFVQPRQETIKLPTDLQMIGLQPVKTTQFPSYKNVKLPISDEKIVAGLHEPITSSKRWLSELAFYLLRQAHLTLRTVHGKVIRVIKL